DEISAGILAFGHRYYVTLPLARGGGILGNALAKLHNRCVASAFALGTETLLGSFSEVGGKRIKADQQARRQAPADDQARDIEQLPTLAEAVLPMRPLPWSDSAPATPAVVPQLDARNAKRALLRLQHNFLESTNELIPTLPSTSVERFVDTAREASTIELAV